MNNTGLIGVRDLDHIIAIVLASAYVENEKPLSCLIVSDRPESGKTSLILRYGGTKGTKKVGKATSYGIIQEHGLELQKGKIKHFLIPEFLGPLSYNSSVVKSFVTFLQEMTEDGLTSIYSGAMKQALVFKEPMVVGVIGAMPRKAYRENILSWMASGFLSRILVVTYRYSDTTVTKIKDSIVGREYLDGKPANLKIPKVKSHIDLPVEVAQACREVADGITAQAQRDGNLYGLRELKHIMSLVMANVALENMDTGEHRDTATMSDFDEIARLSYLFNNQFNELKEGD